MQFPFMKEMTPYPFSTQINIVVTTMAINSFISQEAMIDTLFNEYDNEGAAGYEEEDCDESHAMSFDDVANDEDMMHSDQGWQMWKVRGCHC